MKIERISVKNFKVFKEFEMNFEDINLIYGANGSGKTTIGEIFNFFYQLNEKKVINYRNSFNDATDSDDVFKTFNNIAFNYYNTYCTMDGSYENMSLEVEFTIDDLPGYYEVEINKDNEIVNEIFKYRFNTRIQTIFDRAKNTFCSELAKDIKPYKYHFDNEVKTTYISIIKYLCEVELSKDKLDKSDMFDVISKFTTPCIMETKYHNRLFNLGVGGKMDEVVIIARDSNYEDNYNDFKEYADKLSYFICQIDDSIIDCEYKLDGTHPNSGNREFYVLHTIKNIGGREVEIPMSMESSGTRNYLDYFNWLTQIEEGRNTIIVSDEFGVHLHENLQKRIFDYIIKESRKKEVQVVITTHNTNLMNSDALTSKEKQILNVNPINGSRYIKNLVGRDVKENFALKYKQGIYGGAPVDTKLGDIYE